MLAFFAIALALAAVAHAQDQPAPSQFVGTWKGKVEQTWGQVSASDPLALECINQTLAQDSTLVIMDFPFALSGHPASTTTAGANLLTIPAYPGLSGTFSSFSGSTASVRVNSSTLVCISMERQGSILKILLLGGAGFSVAEQCNSAAASFVPSAFTAPFCKSLPGSRAPFQSTVLG